MGVDVERFEFKDGSFYFGVERLMKMLRRIGNEFINEIFYFICIR